jgi:hypothetical protein
VIWIADLFQPRINPGPGVPQTHLKVGFKIHPICWLMNQPAITSALAGSLGRSYGLPTASIRPMG